MKQKIPKIDYSRSILDGLDAERQFIETYYADGDPEPDRDYECSESTSKAASFQRDSERDRSIARANRKAEGSSPSSNQAAKGVVAAGETHKQSPAKQTPKHEPVQPVRPPATANKAKRARQIANDPAEDMHDMLADLDKELAISHRDDELLLDQAEQSATKASDSTPLIRVDRSKIKKILANKNLSLDRRVALQWFLARYGRSEWMQWQDKGRYPERIGISLLAGWEWGRFITYCGYAGRYCKHPDYCPRCALKERIKPALRQYEGVFDRSVSTGVGRYWYAISPSFECNPDRAGAHFVAEKGDPRTGTKAKTLHHIPWVGQPPVDRLTADYCIGVRNELTDCFEAIFDLAKFFTESGEDGVLAHRHVALHFFETEGYTHHITPNGHFLLTISERLTFEHLKNLLTLFHNLYRRREYGGCLYPDLHCEELTSQAEINRWIAYMFRPMNVMTPYIQAVRRGVNVESLNELVDDRVFQGGNSLLCVPSPRRLGSLRSNGTGYLGGKTVTQQRNEAAAERAEKRVRRSRSPIQAAKFNYLEKQSLGREYMNGEGAGIK